MGSLGWKGFQEHMVFTTFYKGLHEETLDCKRLQGVTTGYWGIKGVTKGYMGLQEVTRG